MSWTDERVERLKTLWADGLSASQIAVRLGDVTRNAVIGKVHRLGLAGRAQPKIRNIRRQRAPLSINRVQTLPVKPTRSPLAPSFVRLTPVSKPAAAPLAKPRPPIATAAAVASLMMTLRELGQYNCRFPVGDPQSADFGFCGHYTKGTYCIYHDAITHKS